MEVERTMEISIQRRIMPDEVSMAIVRPLRELRTMAVYACAYDTPCLKQFIVSLLPVHCSIFALEALLLPLLCANITLLPSSRSLT
jgi:hypothetical protein